MIITNIKKRPQKEIFSDIRSLPGITIASAKEPMEYSEQNTEKFQTILTVKVDGHPWIVKGGFDRTKNTLCGSFSSKGLGSLDY